MKSFSKKLIIFFMAFMLLLHPSDVAASTVKYVDNSHTYTYKGQQYKVYFNGALVSTAFKPAIKKNGSYLIPYQYALVSHGPRIKSAFISRTNCVNLISGTKRIKMYLNKKYFYINNVRNDLKTAPIRIYCKEETYIAVPVREICNAFGWKYTVDDNKKQIKITADIKTISNVDDSLKATQFKKMSTGQFLAKMGPIAREDYKRTGILASVTLSQAILESGWGKSGLAQKSNNLFGIKASVSGNTWKGSTWNGSYVTIRTKEHYSSGTTTITARFRKYPSVAKSIEDHSAYLKYAKNGSRYRYAGITSTRDYRRQLRIIQNGGYCTGSSYYSQLVSIIQSYNLTRWDK